MDYSGATFLSVAAVGDLGDACMKQTSNYICTRFDNEASSLQRLKAI
jgi:hypothetical protein